DGSAGECEVRRRAGDQRRPGRCRADAEHVSQLMGGHRQEVIVRAVEPSCRSAEIPVIVAGVERHTAGEWRKVGRRAQERTGLATAVDRVEPGLAAAGAVATRAANAK